MTVRVGRLVAVAVGGSIILLQIANEQGYIKVNWNKVNAKVDKLADKVEETVTGEGPRWVDKVSISIPGVNPLSGRNAHPEYSCRQQKSTEPRNTQQLVLSVVFLLDLGSKSVQIGHL